MANLLSEIFCLFSCLGGVQPGNLHIDLALMRNSHRVWIAIVNKSGWTVSSIASNMTNQWSKTEDPPITNTIKNRFSPFFNGQLAFRIFYLLSCLFVLSMSGNLSNIWMLVINCVLITIWQWYHLLNRKPGSTELPHQICALHLTWIHGDMDRLESDRSGRWIAQEIDRLMDLLING